MASPAESDFQKFTYGVYKKRIEELVSEASADIKDIEDNHEESTDVSKKIKDSKASLQAIKQTTSSIYGQLHISPLEEARKECKNATKTTPTQSPASDQNREPANTIESPENIQQEAQGDPMHRAVEIAGNCRRPREPGAWGSLLQHFF